MTSAYMRILAPKLLRYFEGLEGAQPGEGSDELSIARDFLTLTQAPECDWAERAAKLQVRLSAVCERGSALREIALALKTLRR